MMRKLIIGMVVVLLGCNNASKPTFTHALYDTIPIDEKYSDEYKFPSFPEGSNINDDWNVWADDGRGGINVTLPSFEFGEIINLPDRRLEPNSAIWYAKTADLEKGVLYIDSDDGAQLWVNDQRIQAIDDGTIFPVDEAKDAELMVRVLNNAMHGGLEEVINITQKDWDTHLLARNEVSDIIFKAKKGARTKLGNPILLTDPIWQRDQKGQFFLSFASDQAGRAEVTISQNDETKIIDWDNSSPYFKIPMPQMNGKVTYQIKLGKAISPEYSFNYTEASDQFSFAFWGDSQSGWDTFSPLVRLMKEYQPEFTFGAGDLVGNGSNLEEYYHLMQSLSQLDVVHYPVPGNHDYDGYYENLYPKNYMDLLKLEEQQQYYAWNHGNVAFIAIDPNMFFPVSVPDTSRQHQWFMDQLRSEEWQNAEWRFITLHQPPFSQGWPGYSGDKSIEDLLIPLLEEHNIDGILTGHSHDYERLLRNYGNQQVAFVISGGGGGGLEPEGLTPEPKMDVVVKEHHFVLIEINGPKATFKAINLENEIIDEFSLQHK